jgi:uncharacterized protein YkwD
MANYNKAMMKRSVMKPTGALSCALVAALLLAGAACDSDGDTETCGMTEPEAKVLKLINDMRAGGFDCGGTHYGSTHRLKCDPALVRAAQDHSADMAENNYFDHTGLDGSSPIDRFREAGYTGSGTWGENIAAGPADPGAVVSMWQASGGHCENIMNPAFTVAGVGHASSTTADYSNYWTLALAAGN